MIAFKTVLIFILFTLIEILSSHKIETDNPESSQYEMTWLKTTLNKETFSNFHKLTGLEIERCAIHGFVPETFQRTPLIILSIHDNIEFPTISESFFEYLNRTLKVFRFNFNPYTTIEDGAFKNLKKLEVLSVTHQNLKRLTQTFLEGLENLKEISLMYNDIEIVDKNSLEHMKNLNAIYLGHNSIKNIEPGTFSNQRKLVDLQLNSNNLAGVNWETFDRIVTLKYLNIAENNLIYVPVQQLLTNFPVLDSINFIPNNFTCSNELYISKTFRHYRINIEYYGPTKSNCSGMDFAKVGITVFSEP